MVCAFGAGFFCFIEGEKVMDTRIALIGIVVSNYGSVEKLNLLLSEYGSFIIGRMGIPHREKNISIISVAVDAPNDIISSLSGKIGMLPGISTKTIYAKTESFNEKGES